MGQKAAQAKQEVFHVDTAKTTAQAEEILNALQQIQDSPELQAEAKTNPDGVLNRLRLSGVARHAVAFGIAGLLVAPAVVKPEMFWTN
jgi:ferric-dicitrate binding protein FerR (iron transport regulator)